MCRRGRLETRGRTGASQWLKQVQPGVRDSRRGRRVARITREASSTAVHAGVGAARSRICAASRLTMHTVQATGLDISGALGGRNDAPIQYRWDREVVAGHNEEHGWGLKTLSAADFFCKPPRAKKTAETGVCTGLATHSESGVQQATQTKILSAKASKACPSVVNSTRAKVAMTPT